MKWPRVWIVRDGNYYVLTRTQPAFSSERQEWTEENGRSVAYRFCASEFDEVTGFEFASKKPMLIELREVNP